MYYCVHCSGPGAAAGHKAAARAGPVLGRPVRDGGQRGHPQHGRPGGDGWVDSEPVNTRSLQILGFCGGRVDAVDGSESIQLGPSALQEDLAPCESLGLQVGQGSALTTLVTTAAPERRVRAAAGRQHRGPHLRQPRGSPGRRGPGAERQGHQGGVRQVGGHWSG